MLATNISQIKVGHRELDSIGRNGAHGDYYFSSEEPITRVVLTHDRKAQPFTGLRCAQGVRVPIKFVPIPGSASYEFAVEWKRTTALGYELEFFFERDSSARVFVPGCRVHGPWHYLIGTIHEDDAKVVIDLCVPFKDFS